MNDLIERFNDCGESVMAFGRDRFVLMVIGDCLNLDEIESMLEDSKAYAIKRLNSSSISFRVGTNSRHRDALIDCCIDSYDRISNQQRSD